MMLSFRDLVESMENGKRNYISKCAEMKGIKVECDTSNGIVFMEEESREENYDSSSRNVNNSKPNSSERFQLSQESFNNEDVLIFDESEFSKNDGQEPVPNNTLRARTIPTKYYDGEKHIKSRKGIMEKIWMTDKNQNENNMINHTDATCVPVDTVMCEGLHQDSEIRNSYRDNTFPVIPITSDKCIENSQGLREERFASKTRNKSPTSKANKHVTDRPSPEDNSENLRCDLCDASFRSMTQVESHKKVHSPIRPFKCPECPRRFNQLAHLNIHKRTHTGEKPFFCQICNKRFSRKDRLRSHLRIHTGEKAYACPKCNNLFKYPWDLKEHMKTKHSGLGLFQCRVCHVSFANLTTFTSHWETHK